MTRAYHKCPLLEANRRAIAAEMFALYQDGLTVTDIGKKYGVTRMAVVLRLKRSGYLTARLDPNGGWGLTLARRRTAETQRADKESLQRWGCTHAQYVILRRTKKVTRAFQYQRRTASDRGIEWQLNLWQWWTIWNDSGHWAHRGKGQGYVMCRYGDSGPYAVGNVFIATAIENSSDKSTKLSHLPIGVYRHGSRFRAQRMIDGKRYRLGAHQTPEIAHAAYLSLGPIGCPNSNSSETSPDECATVADNPAPVPEATVASNSVSPDGFEFRSGRVRAWAIDISD